MLEIKIDHIWCGPFLVRKQFSTIIRYNKTCPTHQKYFWKLRLQTCVDYTRDTWFMRLIELELLVAHIIETIARNIWCKLLDCRIERCRLQA